MSRSHKKHYIFKFAGDTSLKKIFNRRLRRSAKCQDIPSGGAYKKYNDSWDLADYALICSWKEYKKFCWNDDLTEEQNWAEWRKTFDTK